MRGSTGGGKEGVFRADTGKSGKDGCGKRKGGMTGVQAGDAGPYRKSWPGVAAGGRFPELRSGGREFSGKREGIREGPKTKHGNAEWQNARSPISSTNLKLLT